MQTPHTTVPETAAYARDATQQGDETAAGHQPTGAQAEAGVRTTQYYSSEDVSHAAAVCDHQAVLSKASLSRSLRLTPQSPVVSDCVDLLANMHLGTSPNSPPGAIQAAAPP